jgi:hypothetical protein
MNRRHFLKTASLTSAGLLRASWGLVQAASPWSADAFHFGAASYTHVAFCTLRLESSWMITGHAAGVAATMAVKDEITVQKVNVAALQEKLRAQNQVIDFLPGQPEKCEHLNGPPEF